jgi:hypothetical protein
MTAVCPNDVSLTPLFRSISSHVAFPLGCSIGMFLRVQLGVSMRTAVFPRKRGGLILNGHLVRMLKRFVVSMRG